MKNLQQEKFEKNVWGVREPLMRVQTNSHSSSFHIRAPHHIPTWSHEGTHIGAPLCARHGSWRYKGSWQKAHTSGQDQSFEYGVTC